MMKNYGKWSLHDIATSKFKDNFYKNPFQPQFPGRLLTRIFCGVLSGLKSLQLIGYSHLDIKLSNIMLAKDGTPTIIDLGSCQNIEQPISGRVGLSETYANACLPLSQSSSHYDLLCLSLVLFFVVEWRNWET